MKTSTIHSILAMLLTFVLAYPSPIMASECIVSGETKSATIRFGGETHAYYFWAEAGQGAVVEMGDNSEEGVLEPRVQLYGPSGRIRESWGVSRAQIDNCPLTETGIYTIVASDADAYGEGRPDIGGYNLSLVLTGGTTTCPQDPDGADVTPTLTHIGTIALGGDLDPSVFYGEIGQHVSIEMGDYSATGMLEPRIRLYDPTGVPIADSWGVSRATIENHQLEMTGIYTVVASDADAYGEGIPDTGEYGLAVAVMPPKNPYSLYPYHPLPADGNSVDLCEWDSLSWYPVDDATGYDVDFAAGPCMPLEKIAENIQDPHVPMPVVEEEQVCYWRVVAHTPSGDVSGPIWWFIAEPCLSCGLTVSVIGRGAIVDPNEGIHVYSCGEVVPVVAVADPNYEFVRWEGSAVDADGVVIEYQDPMGSKLLVTVDGPYSLRAVFEEVLFDFPLDIDPGWTREGQWEFGMPKEQGGDEHGNPDPASGYTGANVFGVNLNGHYDTSVGPLYSLLAGPFDLRGYTDIKLRFARWLNTDESRYVKVSLDISAIGGNWRTLWESATEILDSQWVLVECPLGSDMDGLPAVYLRWTYQILRERAYPCSGWNLDDIQLCGRRQ